MSQRISRARGSGSWRAAARNPAPDCSVVIEQLARRPRGDGSGETRGDGALKSRYAQHATSGPIPKVVSTRSTLRYELRNLRTTSNSMILVPLLNPKFAIALAARCARTSGSGH